MWSKWSDGHRKGYQNLHKEDSWRLKRKKLKQAQGAYAHEFFRHNWGEKYVAMKRWHGDMTSQLQPKNPLHAKGDTKLSLRNYKHQGKMMPPELTNE